MHRVPTVTIKEKDSGRVRIIDLSAFDAEVHESVSAPIAEEDGFDRQAAMSKLTEADVKFAKNTTNAKLKELVALLEVE